MKTIKETQKETAQEFTRRINKAGLAELHALERRISVHYNAGTLSASGLARLDGRIMREIARFDCIS